MIPCGHVCLCGLCRDALHWHSEAAKLCPVCLEPVENTLKVYFPGLPMEAPLSPQPPIATVMEVQLATKSSDAVILALTDGKSAELMKMDEVQLIEAWAAQ